MPTPARMASMRGGGAGGAKDDRTVARLKPKVQWISRVMATICTSGESRRDAL